MHDTLNAEPIRLTYQDFCVLPEDGNRCEVLDGNLFMSPAPVPLHQRIVGRLYAILDDYVRPAGIGEAFVAPPDVLLSEHDIVESGLVYVSGRRRAIIGPKNIQGAPDLLVEVLAASTAQRDARDKRNIYPRCGLPFYWLVDPENRVITELALANAAYAVAAEVRGTGVFESRAIAGLKIDLRELSK